MHLWLSAQAGAVSFLSVLQRRNWGFRVRGHLYRDTQSAEQAGRGLSYVFLMRNLRPLPHWTVNSFSG